MTNIKKCYLIITIFLLTDVIAVGVVLRYRHRICTEVDSLFRKYYSYKRNNNISRIISLSPLKDEPNEWYDTYQVIAHGGGGIDGKTCTNAKEAIELSYKNGTRMFDVDIQQTSDGVWVCSHGWLDNIEQYSNYRAGISRVFQWDIEQNRYQVPIEKAKKQTIEEFKETKPFHKYTHITFAEFLKFMCEYDDIWLIADLGYIASDKYKSLYRDLISKQDTIVQQHIVITFNTYQDANKLRAINPDIKLHLKRYGMLDEDYYDVAEFCVKNNIHAVNLSIYNIDDEGIKYLQSRGIHVFVAAVDFLSDYQYCKEKGSYGIVSNFLYENDLKLIE